MIAIKDLLARFSSLLLSEEARKSAIIKTLRKFIGVQIKSEDIKITNNTVYLDIKPIYKSEILLKKEKILFELEKILGKKAPEKII